MLVLQSVNSYKRFYCQNNDTGRRLDRVLKKMLPDLPAGIIYSSIRKGRIRVNGGKTKQSYRIENNDTIDIHKSVFFSPVQTEKPEVFPESAAKIRRLTVTRTDNLIFLNKPRGMLTHGDKSLAELLKHGLEDIDQSLSFTPAPLHRLDRNTSGLIVAGLTISGAARFSELIRSRIIKKYYLGLCLGDLRGELTLEDRLIRKNKISKVDHTDNPEGHQAITRAVPILSNGDFTLCLLRIDTGKTHQIRTQMSSAGHPLAGDRKYGGVATGFRSYILHSYAMVLPEFDDICGIQSVSAPLPDDAKRKLERLFSKEYLNSAFNNINYF